MSLISTSHAGADGAPTLAQELNIECRIKDKCDRYQREIKKKKNVAESVFHGDSVVPGEEFTR